LLLIDSVIHQIDTCRFLFGEVSSVYARAKRVSPLVKGEDLVSLHATFPHVDAVIERSYASRGHGPVMSGEAVAIEGTRGSLFLDRDATLRIEVDVPGERRTDRITFDAEACYPQGYANTIAHFVTALREGKEFETGIRDNLKTLEVVFAAYRSIETGEAVRVGRASEEIEQARSA
jgi:predicted dehydrogenase